jgi:hypothetical protein
LIEPTTSSIRFAGEGITALDRQLRNTRRAMRMVNLEPLLLHPKMTPAEPRERLNAITTEVRLGTGLVDRYPHGLSLGTGNASTLRPIAAHPSLVVLNLPTSALVSLRSLIILLLEALRGARLRTADRNSRCASTSLATQSRGSRARTLWAYKHVQGGSGTDLHVDMGMRWAHLWIRSRRIRLRSVLKLAASRFCRFECPRIGFQPCQR